MVDYFKFENHDEDLPLYSGESVLSLKTALLLFACLILFAVPVVFPIAMGELEFSLYLCLVLLLPTLYILRGKLNLLFKRIRLGDVKIIVLCVVLSLVYSFAMIFLLTDVGIASSEPLEEMALNLISFICVPIQLMGEELFKILTFLLSMFVLYRFSDNRKVSLVVSMFISMVAFGFMHAGFYGGFLQVFLIQGLGSIFNFYGYLKTRNILVSYAAHLIFDLILIIP